MDSKTALNMPESVMFIGSHDSNTCVGLAIDVDFAHQVRDYVEENDQNVIDISNVAFNIEKYRLVGQIPTGYFQATNGPVIRGLCSGRNTFWALPVTAEEYGRLRRDINCRSRPICFCAPYCICEDVWSCW